MRCIAFTSGRSRSGSGSSGCFQSQPYGAFDKAVYYVHDGYLGQWQESGRDQGHTTLGIALMGPIMETTWNQGEDWYGRDNNRFLAAAEYVAKYNLGNDVPFYPYAWGTGQKGKWSLQPGVSPAGRGHMRPGFELVLHHYLNRRGIAAPYTSQYAAKIRPEGGGFGHPSSFDQLGFGTLTATRDPEVNNPRPSGLTVLKRSGKAVLSWWGAPGAETYNVKRATAARGPYTTVAKDIKHVLTYTDEALQPASVYYYVVTGMQGTGETAPSDPVGFSVAPVLRTHLKFDETSGDKASNAVNRAALGTLPNKGSWSAGKAGNAVSLNGKDQYIELPVGVVSGISDFTIAAWVNLDEAPLFCRIFDFGDNRQWMFLTPNLGNGMPRFEIATTYHYNAVRLDGTAPFPMKRWVHVAVTLSGREGTIYLDGVAAGKHSDIGLQPFRLYNSRQNWIGRSQHGRDRYLNGKVDDFRIYDGALTPEEIAKLAKAGESL